MKQCQITEVQFLFCAKRMSNCFVHEYPPNRGSEFRLQTEPSFRIYNLEFWTSSLVIFHDLDNYEV